MLYYYDCTRIHTLIQIDTAALSHQSQYIGCTTSTVDPYGCTTIVTEQPARDGSTHFVIVNTMDRPPGQHWMGLYREGDRQILFESFDCDSRKGDLKLFPGLETTEPDAEQPISRHPHICSSAVRPAWRSAWSARTAA
jgi:hypothetical protein